VEGQLNPALSFGSVASLYDSVRPSYPVECVRYAVGDSVGDAPRRVVDVGAGTGKFTEIVAMLGHDVVAVEPDDDMRAQLSVRFPQLVALAGTGESIPLPDSSVDAVVVAQAFHWMNARLALTEMARVLRPGGSVGLIWNMRDSNVAWVGALSELLEGGNNTLPESIPTHPDFSAFERKDFRFDVPMDADALVQLVSSRSYVITMPDDKRADLLSQVRTLATNHPDLAGKESFTAPYVTTVFRAVRRPTAT
jgi:SAM-dependent methyltransferase